MNSIWRVLDLEPTSSGEIGRIKTVKRLKDDKVFSIGDRTYFGTIREFQVSGGTIHAYTLSAAMYGYDGPARYEIVSLEHLR